MDFTAFQQEPYGWYEAARSQGPVIWMELPGMIGWFVTGHAETDRILKDSRFTREAHKFMPPEMTELSPQMQGMMLFRDVPQPTRLRSFVSKTLTPRMIERLQPRIRGIARELLKK